jgi:hypothetical protein
VGGFGRWTGGLCLLSIIATIAAGTSASADVVGTEQRAPRVRIPDGVTAAALRRAIEQARRRLESPSCRELLSDFTDGSGRTLQAVLAEAGQSPEQYVQELFFYDGASHRRCRTGGARAVTVPGSRVVLVCTQEFVRTHVSRRNRGNYEFVVIHEMLHSLGLGEDPPSSSEINARVRARCGE